MTRPEDLTKETWEHNEGDSRIEHIAANNPRIGDDIEKLALRFISAKGLSEEFAEALEGVRELNEDSDPSP